MTPASKAKIAVAVVAMAGLAGAAILVLGWQREPRELSPEEIQSLPYATVERHLPAQHPYAYLFYAARVFGEKSRQEGVVWFYVAQIRFRFHLAVNPGRPDEDAAAFGAMQAMLGDGINRYAGSDPDMWIELIDQAIQWDADHPNHFTSKRRFRKDYQEVLDGLNDLKKHIVQNRQDLLDRDGMPGEWPPLVDLESVDGLVGSFTRDSFTLLIFWLLGEDLTPEILRESEFVHIQPDSRQSIKVVAAAGEREIASRVINLTRRGPGYAWTEKLGRETPNSVGARKIRTALYRNSEQELVFERTFFQCLGRTESDAEWDYTFVMWERASAVETTTEPSEGVSDPGN